MPPSRVHLSVSVNSQVATSGQFAHPGYRWIWAAFGCFALGPHEPLNLRPVSFWFIGMTAIKKD